MAWVLPALAGIGSAIGGAATAAGSAVTGALGAEGIAKAGASAATKAAAGAMGGGALPVATKAATGGVLGQLGKSTIASNLGRDVMGAAQGAKGMLSTVAPGGQPLTWNNLLTNYANMRDSMSRLRATPLRLGAAGADKASGGRVSEQARNFRLQDLDPGPLTLNETNLASKYTIDDLISSNVGGRFLDSFDDIARRRRNASILQ